ncbi:hypothetical protein T12_1084 [Trichinella patagoniensis]|uniref:Uncharacterized protein n=1 Tax=Trichinella patagoniensis TaxID=990121 RepID=A0A0V0ZA21_9BILA|nr:hypothetical protein T12_1084 [Trichinella patagoniensis]
MQADQSTQRIYVRFIRLRIIRGTNSVDSNERRDNMQQGLTTAREIDGYSKEHQIYIELAEVSLTPTWGVPQSATVGHHRRGWGHADGVGDVPFGTYYVQPKEDCRKNNSPVSPHCRDLTTALLQAKPVDWYFTELIANESTN